MSLELRNRAGQVQLKCDSCRAVSEFDYPEELEGWFTEGPRHYCPICNGLDDENSPRDAATSGGPTTRG